MMKVLAWPAIFTSICWSLLLAPAGQPFDLPAALAAAQPGDQVVCMSNGGFGGIHDQLLAGLRARA